MCSPNCIDQLESRIRASIEKYVLEVLNKYQLVPTNLSTESDPASKNLINLTTNEIDQSNLLSKCFDQLPLPVDFRQETNESVSTVNPTLATKDEDSENPIIRKKKRRRRPRKSKSAQLDKSLCTEGPASETIDQTKETKQDTNDACESANTGTNSNIPFTQQKDANDRPQSIESNQISRARANNLSNHAENFSIETREHFAQSPPSLDILPSTTRTGVVPFVRSPSMMTGAAPLSQSSLHLHHSFPSLLHPTPFSFTLAHPTMPLMTSNLYPRPSSSSFQLSHFHPNHLPHQHSHQYYPLANLQQTIHPNSACLSISSRTSQEMMASQSNRRLKNLSTRSESPPHKRKRFSLSPLYKETRRITSARKRPTSYRRSASSCVQSRSNTRPPESHQQKRKLKEEHRHDFSSSSDEEERRRRRKHLRKQRQSSSTSSSTTSGHASNHSTSSSYSSSSFSSSPYSSD